MRLPRHLGRALARRGQWYRAALAHGRERDEAFRSVATRLDAGRARCLALEPLPPPFRDLARDLARTAPPGPPVRIAALLFDRHLALGTAVSLRSAHGIDGPELHVTGRGELAISVALARLLGQQGLADTAVEEEIHRRVRAVALDLPPDVSGACDGPSLDLAVALRVWSDLVGLARPLVLLVSGELGPDGEVSPVGELAEKLRGGVAEHPDADLLLVPPGGAAVARAVVGSRPPAVEVSDLAAAIEAVGFLPNAAELRLQCARVDRRISSEPGSVDTARALLGRTLRSLDPALPDRRWGEAMAWDARLSRSVDPDAPIRGAAELIESLAGDGPGSATAPEVVLDAVVQAVDLAIDGLRWSDVDRFERLLDTSSTLAPLLAPGDPFSAWMARAVAPELTRLHAIFGHAALQLDHLDRATAHLAEARRLATADGRARVAIHQARVCLRAGEHDGAQRALTAAREALPAARAASFADRSSVNYDLVRWRLAIERDAAASKSRFAEARSDPRPLHDDDRVPACLSAARRAWLLRDEDAFEQAIRAIGRPEYPLDHLLLAALHALRGWPDTVDLGAIRERASLGLGREIEATLFAHHSAFAAVRDTPTLAAERVWRLPYLGG